MRPAGDPAKPGQAGRSRPAPEEPRKRMPAAGASGRRVSPPLLPPVAAARRGRWRRTARRAPVHALEARRDAARQAEIFQPPRMVPARRRAAAMARQVGDLVPSFTCLAASDAREGVAISAAPCGFLGLRLVVGRFGDDGGDLFAEGFGQVGGGGAAILHRVVQQAGEDRLLRRVVLGEDGGDLDHMVHIGLGGRPLARLSRMGARSEQRGHASAAPRSPAGRPVAVIGRRPPKRASIIAAHFLRDGLCGMPACRPRRYQ